MADMCVRMKRNTSDNDSVNVSRKRDRGSVYSMVSSSDLTPGSLDVWLELPDEIKYDPALAPFKKKYEQQRGTVESNEAEKIIHNTDNNNSTNVNLKESNKDPVLKLIEPRIGSDEEKCLKSKKHTKLARILRTVKLTALVASWILLTVSLLLNREKSDVILHTAVIGGEVKEYVLSQNNETSKVLVTLTGPFSQTNTNSTNMLYLWLYSSTGNDTEQFQQESQKWAIQLPADDIIDFSPSATDSKTLVLDERHIFNNNNYSYSGNFIFNDTTLRNFTSNETKLTLRISTSSNKTVPLTVSYQLSPLDYHDGLIYSTVLLLSLYLLIIFEIVNRTLAALLSSSLGIAVLAISGVRPTLPELVSWLDVETLLLLFSMMLLVAILAETGLFDYLAVVAFEVTGGRTWPLINCLCLFTAVFSTFLDNVTTVLLMTPVTIRLCEVMELNPVPVLMCMVIFSNVGGAATPVGDPPNVIIATHPAVLQENINFTSFTLHMSVGILLVAVQTYFQLRFMFRDVNKLRHNIPKDIQACLMISNAVVYVGTCLPRRNLLTGPVHPEFPYKQKRQEIAVWRRAAASLASYSRDEDIVRRAIEKKVNKLTTALARREAKGGPSKSDPAFSSTLATMKQKYRIRDKQLLIKSAVCVTFVVVVFFLHSVPALQRLSLGWTALLGALLLLLLAERDDLEPILARVEWSTLLFFAALFVLMEALSKLGMIQWIGNVTENLILQVGEESRLAVALMLVLWVSGLASAFVDNIPLTTMMIRVIVALSSPSGLGLPLAPLAWALSFGACLGGNGTLIGASANVVCAGVAEQHGYRFTFLQFLKIGFPIMIGNLIVASIYLLFCHCLLQWH